MKTGRFSIYLKEKINMYKNHHLINVCTWCYHLFMAFLILKNSYASYAQSDVGYHVLTSAAEQNLSIVRMVDVQ